VVSTLIVPLPHPPRAHTSLPSKFSPAAGSKALGD
jgi:hypothetical protein